jgi:hypothetical protein
MRNFARTAALLVLAAATSAMIGCHGVGTPASETQGTSGRDADRGRVLLAGTDVEGIAASIAAGAMAMLGDQVPVEQRGALRQEIALLVGEQMRPDFAAYTSRMASKGLEVDEMAEAFADLLLPGPEEYRDRLKEAWDDPDSRLVRWDSVSPEAISAGLGLTTDTGTDWPESSTHSQMSLFSPPGGRLSVEEAERIEGGEQRWRAVWVQVPVTLSGMETHVRLILLYHQQSQQWIPLVIVIGTEPGRRVLPLL